MSASDWEAFEQRLQEISDAEKLEMLKRVSRSLRGVRPTLTAEQQRHNLLELMERMRKLPVHNPDDGFSSEEHDRILYGEST